MRTALLLACVALGACGGPAEQSLAEYRAAYEARWGAVDLTDWTIDIVPGKPTLDGTSRTGVTYWNEKRIVLWIGALEAFPHELHHVALGPDSVDHAGWCEFGEWELHELNWDEMSYLGCR